MSPPTTVYVVAADGVGVASGAGVADAVAAGLTVGATDTVGVDEGADADGDRDSSTDALVQATSATAAARRPAATLVRVIAEV